MEENSKCYLTNNTNKDLFSTVMHPMELLVLPAIFQKIMDQILQGLDGVICYLDDILIIGRDRKDHLRNLEEVLR